MHTCRGKLPFFVLFPFRFLVRFLGRSWGDLGAFLGGLGAVLGPSWVSLRALFSLLGGLGASWGGLGASWGGLGTILGCSWLARSFLGLLLGDLEAVLGPSWEILGRNDGKRF